MPNERDERFTRYSEIIPPHVLANTNAVIVGVGAIGRQLALQLASMGVAKLTLIDPDKVEEVNYGTQGFCPDQKGMLKADATASDCETINPDIEVNWVPEKFDPKTMTDPDANIIFSCVDCMEARGQIMEAYMGLPRIDSRMSARIIQTYLVHSPELYEAYKATLFSNEEGHQERCTAKSTIYTANMAASMAVNSWVQFVSGSPTMPFSELSLFSMTLSDCSPTVSC